MNHPTLTMGQFVVEADCLYKKLTDDGLNAYDIGSLAYRMLVVALTEVESDADEIADAISEGVLKYEDVKIGQEVMI
jgi:hypothetical protein